MIQSSQWYSLPRNRFYTLYSPKRPIASVGVIKLFSQKWSCFGVNPNYSSNQTISKQISTSTCQTDAPSGSDSPSKNPYSFNISSLIPGTISKPELARKVAKCNPGTKPNGQKPVPSNAQSPGQISKPEIINSKPVTSTPRPEQISKPIMTSSRPDESRSQTWQPWGHKKPQPSPENKTGQNPRKVTESSKPKAKLFSPANDVRPTPTPKNSLKRKHDDRHSSG